MRRAAGTVTERKKLMIPCCIDNRGNRCPAVLDYPDYPGHGYSQTEIDNHIGLPYITIIRLLSLIKDLKSIRRLQSVARHWLDLRRYSMFPFGSNREQATFLPPLLPYKNSARSLLRSGVV
jgi:hypothetical protein